MTTDTQDTLTTGSGPLAATDAPAEEETQVPVPEPEETPEPAPAPASTADGQVGTVYMIQQEVELEGGDATWLDVGRVTVPKRSSLKTVFDAALEELQELRPTEAAPVQVVRAVQPEDVAEWEAVFEKPPAPPAQVVVRPRAT